MIFQIMRHVEEAQECPVCWESFNIIENVCYVLWCGHTLCKNCVLGLQRAAIKFSAQQIQFPFFISCPWCNLLTFQLVYKGNLRSRNKNFFLLWMVESRGSDRVKSPTSVCRQDWSPSCNSVPRNYSSNMTYERMHHFGCSSTHNNDTFTSERLQMPFHKSLDLVIRITAKFSLVVLLLMVIFSLPTGAAILMLYLVIMVLFAVPAFLELYFAYPALNWLRREIRT